MKPYKEKKINWIYNLKRRIIFCLLCLLAFYIVISAVVIYTMLSENLMKDSMIKTKELGESIKSSLKILMLNRSPNQIQTIIENLSDDKTSISSAMIIDRKCKIVYSNNKKNINNAFELDNYCKDNFAAYKDNDLTQTTVTTDAQGQKVFRTINLISNEKECYDCHSKDNKVNGALIIERPLAKTKSLINTLNMIVFATAVGFILILIPILIKMLNKYIHEIVNKNAEISLLYYLVDSISKSIDMEELKRIVVDITIETLSADEVVLVFPRPNNTFRVYSRQSDEQTPQRKKIHQGDITFPIIDKWLEGKLKEHSLDDRNKVLFIPISKNDEKLALLIAFKYIVPFTKDRLNLINAMETHIAIALDNARLYTIAITDELTKLYAKRHFNFSIDSHITAYKTQSTGFSLILLDIDNFKNVNDTYGHVIGDQVLKEMANCVLESLRDGDLAFRYGGEEFVIILPRTDLNVGVHVAERIRETVQNTVFVKDVHNLKLTISLGVSHCPTISDNANDLIVKADNALYEAKHSGKNRVISARN
ncbi:GAF sensor-containing diguanylate cyclase [Candidatus Magnetoovum chiemensis]|nr:GAF sensor-containing diguanylate cyclase [Candidatus Magnetoovum chiemensis]